MKNTWLIILMQFFLISCIGQTNSTDTTDYTKTIKEKAELMCDLFLKQDFKTYIKFIDPKLVEMMGGEDEMINEIKKGIEEMESQGMGFQSLVVGNPYSILKVNNELQCLVPQKLEMKVPQGKLISESTLIAISTDDGESWYFIDTYGKDIQAMKKIFPNLSDELKIPEKQLPVLYEE